MISGDGWYAALVLVDDDAGGMVGGTTPIVAWVPDGEGRLRAFAVRKGCAEAGDLEALLATSPSRVELIGVYRDGEQPTCAEIVAGAERLRTRRTAVVP